MRSSFVIYSLGFGREFVSFWRGLVGFLEVDWNDLMRLGRKGVLEIGKFLVWGREN